MRRQSAFPRDAVETPAFIVRPAAIAASRDELARLCGLAGCRALYSLKALGLPDVLRLMVPQLAGFSASSLYEAAAGTPGRRAASQGAGDLARAARSRLRGACPVLRCHILQLSVAECPSRWLLLPACAQGLRINPQISQIEDERYDPCRKHSKLGEPASNLRRLKALPPGISGIHFHNTCEADDFSGLKPTIERLQCEIPHILAQVSWINLGGGYEWSVPRCSRATHRGNGRAQVDYCN